MARREQTWISYSPLAKGVRGLCLIGLVHIVLDNTPRLDRALRRGGSRAQATPLPANGIFDKRGIILE